MNMQLNRRHYLALTAALAMPAAQAQSWPNKPIRLVVPFAAGGSTDVLARMLGQKLGEMWGQSVVVENRGGAGGNIGTDIVAKAAPDGYTLVFASGSVTINPALYASMPFDTMRDLTPISNVANGPMLVVVQDKAPWRNIKELIQFAKSNPGKINFGSAGVGSQVHLASEKFADAAAIEITHVPYRGESVALNDLLSGQVQLMVGNIAAASALLGAGRLRALAVTGKARSPLLPDVPTVSESALPGFEYAGWFGLLGPAGLPRPIVDKIYQDTARVVGESQFKGRLFVSGVTPVLSTPQQMTAQMEAELKSWSQVIKNRKLKAS